MNLVEQLAHYALFRGLSAEDYQGLIDVMQQKHYAPGETLFKRGDPGDAMYLILKGRVKIYTRDAGGNVFTLRYLSEMFGEFAMLDGRSRSTYAEADGELDVLILYRDDFIKFLNKRPIVGVSLMRNLVERVRYTTVYLQQVMDATHQLAQGDFESISSIPQAASHAETEIRELIGAFIDMAQALQMRTLQYQSATPDHETPSDSAGQPD